MVRRQRGPFVDAGSFHAGLTATNASWFAPGGAVACAMRRCLPIALAVALAPAAALVALLASPAFAYHDTLGDGASIAGGASIGVILPIVVVVVLLIVGVGMWGRKKPKTKSKRRKRRRGH